MDRSAAAAIMGVLLAALGCRESASVGGAWSGANARYTGVVLDLTAIGDSVAGSIDVTPTGSARFTTVVNGRQSNDSLYVWGDPLAPSAGGGFGTRFAGRRLPWAAAPVVHFDAHVEEFNSATSSCSLNARVLE